MLQVFAVLALVLAALGLYGALAYMVEQRRNEIGVRRALGAARVGAVTMVVRRGLVLTLTGIVLGTGLALALGGTLDFLLFGIAARDPWIHVLAALGMLAISVVASWIPAHHAAGVPPTEALRAE